MSLCLIRQRTATGVLLGLSLLIHTGLVNAQPSQAEWIRYQILNHPGAVAARETMNADVFRAEALQQPVFNPGLHVNYEKEGESDNYSIGVSQTLDLHNIEDAQNLQGNLLRVAAEQEYRTFIQHHIADSLLAIVKYQAAHKRFLLAQEQEKQLNTLVRLVRQRQNTGDLGKIDVELALLSLASRLSQTAESIAAYRVAESELRQRLPDWDGQPLMRREEIWKGFRFSDDQVIDELPGVIRARAAWQYQQKNAEASVRTSGAAPEITLNAGKNGGESVAGLSVSLPLNIRNNYKAAHSASQKESLAAEAEYRAIRMRAENDVKTSTVIAVQYRKQYEQWRELAEGRQDVQKLLARQWQSGDLSTSQYLQALQQYIDGSLAGIRLTEQYRASVIRWLLSRAETGLLLSF